MPHISSYCVNHCVNFMCSSLGDVLSSYMVRSAWTCLIALLLPDLELLCLLMICQRRTLIDLYGRAIQKQLKQKLLQKWISNGVKFHQAKVIKVIHEESKSLLICNDCFTVQVAMVGLAFLDALFSMTSPIILVTEWLMGFQLRSKNTHLM